MIEMSVACKFSTPNQIKKSTRENQKSPHNAHSINYFAKLPNDLNIYLSKFSDTGSLNSFQQTCSLLSEMHKSEM